MKTYGQEIWEKKMKEQGTIGVIGGIVNSKNFQDKAMKYILKILDLELFGLLKGKDILDVGVGDGRFLINFNQRGFNCDGLDVSPSIIEFVKKRIQPSGFKSELFLRDITKEKVDKKYDLVFCTGTFGHFPSFLAKDVLTNFKKMLKKDGLMYIAFWKPQKLNIKNILHRFFYDILRLIKSKFSNSYAVNCSSYSKEDIEELARTSKLELVKVIEKGNEYLVMLK